MTRDNCPDCGRPIANREDWARASKNSSDGGDPEAPWAVALCWGSDANCTAVSHRERIAALEAEVARLRRERDEVRRRLAGVGDAMGVAGNRWEEWGARAEAVGDALHCALYGPVEGDR